MTALLGLVPEPVAVPEDDFVRVTALGTLTVRHAGEVVRIPAQSRWLLGLLALRANSVVALDEIVAVIWPADPPRAYRERLHTYVARLRRPLGSGAVNVQWCGNGYELAAGADSLDVLEFAAYAATGDAKLAVGNRMDAAHWYGRALDLWKGQLLGGTDGRLDNHPEAVQLSRHRVTTCLRFADLAARCGLQQRAVDALSAVCHAEPLDEAVHGRLMSALADVGRRADALTVFHGLRARLVDELGVEPGAEVTQVFRELLDGRPPRGRAWVRGTPFQ
ncbi:AfsR/SARP family transcriptional regulator [Pseudonocardia sp. TRM90224]|uniref:AfsR/SARP family transcriptional regulator n=1 Tax=Pseudonocardia sp. TRM90224 TaxID=2812678 RepID=UPI001E32B2A9|nr:BTAD domain-containing putative transcriptional regulator [Pseudonocardia sp. TRM90224]